MGTPSGETPRKTRKVNEITLVPYAEFGCNCDPSRDDIQCALDEGNLEERAFQRDLEELKAEWLQASNNARDAAEWIRQLKSYHARRVAWFVAHGWSDPITIGSDGKIKDGLHRLHAAKFLGNEEVEVVLEP